MEVERTMTGLKQRLGLVGYRCGRVNTPIDDSKNGTTCRESREESGKATTGTCVFLLSPNPITLSRGTLGLPNNGILRVNLLELGVVGSNAGFFGVDVPL